MVARELDIIAVDLDTGRIAWHCPGPDAEGACGRIAIGEEVPCAGKALSVAGSRKAPYVVPHSMTLCPVTLALVMGVPLANGEPAPTPVGGEARG